MFKVNFGLLTHQLKLTYHHPALRGFLSKIAIILPFEKEGLS